MASLGKHLRELEGHGGLPFHPDCPRCRRERLTGLLASHPLVSRRTQAALAASLLALTAVAPATAAAAPDRADQQRNEPAPETSGNSDSTDQPDFDPGGSTPSLEEAPSAPAPSVDNSDSGTVDAEPANDSVAPVTGPDSSRQAVPVLPHAPSAPPPPTTAGGSTAITTPPPASPSRPAVPTPAPSAHAPHRRHTPAVRSGHADRRVAHAPGRLEVLASPPVGADLTTQETAAGRETRVAEGERLHIVAAGECLWSIARASLGDGASEAQVARQVHRIWELNKDKIATGDPNLLMIGTKLTLP